MEGRHEIKVYYEDTDCMGVVYHASYLRFFERGRTELIAEIGRSITAWQDAGYLFAVYKIEITFRRPARLGDVCQVVTSFAPRRSQYRICMTQRLWRGTELIAEAQVQLVCIGPQFEVKAFPEELLRLSPARATVTKSSPHGGSNTGHSPG